MNAQAIKTLFAPRISSSDNPIVSIYLIALYEALNSTGKVTKLNNKTIAYRPIAKATNPDNWKATPTASKIIHAFEPKLANGTNAVRNFIIPYPSAC